MHLIPQAHLLHTPVIPNTQLMQKKKMLHTPMIPKSASCTYNTSNIVFTSYTKMLSGRLLTRFWDTADMSVQSDADLIMCISEETTSSSTFITFLLTDNHLKLAKPKVAVWKHSSFSSKPKSSIIKLWVCFFVLRLYVQNARFV